MSTETKKAHTNPVLVYNSAPLFLKSSKVKNFEVDSCGYKIIGCDDEIILQSSDIREGLRFLWDEQMVINIPLCGKYSLTIRPKRSPTTRKPEFTARVVSRKKLGFEQYGEIDHYNLLGGYWYTPEYLASEQVKRKMKSYPIQCIRNVLSMFNTDQ